MWILVLVVWGAWRGTEVRVIGMPKKPPRVAIVTDSTASLSAAEIAELGIRVVPLRVTVGSVTGVDGTDVTPSDVVAALGERRLAVRTSRPSRAELADAYQAALDDGAEAVLAVHVSSALSGTYDSALVVARDLPDDRVAVVDSGSTAMGLGFPVRAAVAAARAGGDLADVQAATEAVVRSTATLFYVDTLEFLRRGGRIGAAAALVGTALAVKPILSVSGGQVTVAERVRTAARGLARLEELTVSAAVDRAGDGLVDVAVHHLAAAERANALADRLATRLPGVRRLVCSEVGAVVGAHVGPGVVAAVVSPAVNG